VTPRRLGKVLPWAALGVVVAFALVVGSHRPAGPTPLAARVRSIAAGIRCPTCQGETAAESQVYAARAIRADIAQRLKARQSPGEIRAYLVSRYGTGILESPPVHGLTALVWYLPVVVIPAAAVVLVVGLRRSRHKRSADSVLSEEDRALVAAALATQPSPPAALRAEIARSQAAERREAPPTQVPAVESSSGDRDRRADTPAAPNASRVQGDDRSSEVG
jgi:cytochrome c-type biogenesis protein CcmH/NrfF